MWAAPSSNHTPRAMPSAPDRSFTPATTAGGSFHAGDAGAADAPRNDDGDGYGDGAPAGMLAVKEKPP